jgi:hypothetical protein
MALDPFEADLELQRYHRAQLREYTLWVADGDIRVGNALAYRAGDAVPASNVDEDGRVILARHTCGTHAPCGHQGEPIDWGEVGMVRRVDTRENDDKPARIDDAKPVHDDDSEGGND